MNNLDKLIAQRGISKKETASRSGIEVTMLSRYINHRCLPLKEERESLARLFGVAQTDIWDRADFSLGLPTKRIDTSSGYKFTVRLEDTDRRDIEELMKEMGVSSCKEFMRQLVKNTQTILEKNNAMRK